MASPRFGGARLTAQQKAPGPVPKDEARGLASVSAGPVRRAARRRPARPRAAGPPLRQREAPALHRGPAARPVRVRTGCNRGSSAPPRPGFPEWHRRDGRATAGPESPGRLVARRAHFTANDTACSTGSPAAGPATTDKAGRPGRRRMGRGTGLGSRLGGPRAARTGGSDPGGPAARPVIVGPSRRTIRRRPRPGRPAGHRGMQAAGRGAAGILGGARRRRSFFQVFRVRFAGEVSLTG
jgi:hypothetical protein